MILERFWVLRRASGGCVVLLGLVLAGCATRSIHDQTFVSDSVQSRVGRGLRPLGEAASVLLPEVVSLADGLSEEEASAVALWNNAEFAAALGDLGLARADLVEAGLIRNPIFSLLFPWGPKQLELALSWPFEALWQRPRRVAAAQIDVERVAQRLVQGGLDLVRDTRVAHADLLLAEERGLRAQDSQQIRARIAEIADARVRLGDASVMEATAARMDAARAEEEMLRSAHDAETARDRLRTLLGLSAEDAAFSLVAGAGPGVGALPVATLVREARAARPDLRAAELGVEAAAKRAGLARSEIVTLSGILDANGTGRDGFELGPGLALELPFFGRNKGRLARAEAELDQEAKRYVAALQRIELEVRQARTAVVQAREALQLWQGRLIPLFAHDAERARQALAAGETSSLSVLEAERLLIDARIREAEALAALRRAAANLDRAVGKSSPPAVAAGSEVP